MLQYIVYFAYLRHFDLDFVDVGIVVVGINCHNFVSMLELGLGVGKLDVDATRFAVEIDHWNASKLEFVV